MRARRWLAAAGALGLALSAGGAVPASAATGEVAVVAGGFSPATIRIAPGDRVRWSNQTDEDHRIKQDDGSGERWDTGNLSPGEQQSHTFDEPGFFRYHCETHPAMTGAVEVADPQATTTTAPPTTTTTAPPTTTTVPPTTAPPTTTTTAPPSTTTAPAPTTTTAPRPSSSAAPATTTTVRETTTSTGPAPTSSSATSSSTPSSSSSTSSSTTTTTLAVAPAAPAETTTTTAAPLGSLNGRRPDLGPTGSAGPATSVATGQASGLRPLGDGGSNWGALAALAALVLTAMFGLWSLWSLRPSRI